MSHLEIQDEKLDLLAMPPKFLKISRRIISIFVRIELDSDPQYVLYKAFHRWSKIAPLMEKCDELARHLKERNDVLTNVRNCYLRDVIRVKQYLHRVSLEINLKESTLLNELGSLPSIDLRDFEEHGLSDRASHHIRGGLSKLKIQGIEKTNPSLQIESLNPWERSEHFRKSRVLKSENPDAVLLPEGGNSISLYAPNKYKLFVKYCPTCIGIMTLVHDWNEEVSEGLAKTYDKTILESQIEHLKRNIQDMNNIIIQQQEEVFKYVHKLDDVEKTSVWIDHWRKGLDKNPSENEVKNLEQIEKWQYIAEMSAADVETTSYNLHTRYRNIINKQAIEKRQIKSQLQIQTQENILLNQRINELTQQLQLKHERVEKLEDSYLQQYHLSATLQAENTQLDLTRQQNFEKITSLQQQVVTLTNTSRAEISQLNKQLSTITTELTSTKLFLTSLQNDLKTTEINYFTEKSKAKELEEQLHYIDTHVNVSEVDPEATFRYEEEIKSLNKKLGLVHSLVPWRAKLLLPFTILEEGGRREDSQDLTSTFEWNDSTGGNTGFSPRKSLNRHNLVQYESGPRNNQRRSSQIATVSAPRHSTPKKWRLKAVCLGVIYLLRWFRCLRSLRYKDLGIIGYDIMDKIQTETIARLSTELSRHKDQLLILQPQLENAASTRDQLLQENAMLNERFGPMSTQLSATSLQLQKAMDAMDDMIHRNDPSFAQKLRRQERTRRKVSAQLQRNLARQLANVMMSARRRISLILTSSKPSFATESGAAVDLGAVSDAPAGGDVGLGALGKPMLVSLTSFGPGTLPHYHNTNQLLDQGNDQLSLQMKSNRKKRLKQKLVETVKHLCDWTSTHKHQLPCDPLKLKYQYTEFGFLLEYETDMNKVNNFCKYFSNEMISLEASMSRLHLDNMSLQEYVALLQDKVEEYHNMYGDIETQNPNFNDRFVSRQHLAEINVYKQQITELDRVNKALLYVTKPIEKKDQSVQTETNGKPSIREMARLLENESSSGVWSQVVPPPRRRSFLDHAAKSEYIHRNDLDHWKEAAVGAAVSPVKRDLEYYKNNYQSMFERNGQLSKEIIQLKSSLESLENSKKVLGQDFETVLKDYTYLDKQNCILRIAIQDGYKKYSKELETRLQDVKQHSPTTISTSTQIACVVCALRPSYKFEGIGRNEALSMTPGLSHDAVHADPTNLLEMTTTVDVDGDVILSTHPRDINENTHGEKVNVDISLDKRLSKRTEEYLQKIRMLGDEIEEPFRWSLDEVLRTSQASVPDMNINMKDKLVKIQRNNSKSKLLFDHIEREEAVSARPKSAAMIPNSRWKSIRREAESFNKTLRRPQSSQGVPQSEMESNVRRTTPGESVNQQLHVGDSKISSKFTQLRNIPLHDKVNSSSGKDTYEEGKRVNNSTTLGISYSEPLLLGDTTLIVHSVNTNNYMSTSASNSFLMKQHLEASERVIPYVAAGLQKRATRSLKNHVKKQISRK